MIVIVGSWSAAVTLRNGWWLLLIVPALALLATLQACSTVLPFIASAPDRLLPGVLHLAFIGTIVGAVIAGFVRLWSRAVRPISFGRDLLQNSGVVVPALGMASACLAAVVFNWFLPAGFGPVLAPAILIWLLCWLIEARRQRQGDAEGKDYRFKLAMVGFAALLAIEAQLQIAVENATCGPFACGGRFFITPDRNPYPFWDRSILGFLPQPDAALVPNLIYAPMLLAAMLCCAILLLPRSQRLPRKRAIAMAALAAIAVGYTTPTYEYSGWSHYPTPTLGIGL